MTMRSVKNLRNIYFVLILFIFPLSHLQAHEPVIVNIDDAVFFCEGKNLISISDHKEKRFKPFNFKFSFNTEQKSITYKSDDFNFSASSVVHASKIAGVVRIVAEDWQSVTDRMTLDGDNFFYFVSADKNSFLITAVCDQF